MPHHHVAVFVHLVWRVHMRSPRIDGAMQAWLWPALAEKARELGAEHVLVGGVADHVHVLAALPSTLAVAELVRRLKGASSRVAHRKGIDDYAWQEGYGAFSVSPGHFGIVSRYVENQAHHHRQGSTDAAMELNDFEQLQPEGHLEQ